VGQAAKALDGLPESALVLLLMAGFGLNGVIVPAAFLLPMERHSSLAGPASTLIGTLNFA